MSTKAMCRPARITSSEFALDQEMRAARYLYHRLLDFEDQHQAVLDNAAEAAAPGIVRVARIIAILQRRVRRRERSTSGSWSPNPHTDWLPGLRSRLDDLRKIRNASDGWKAALKWADEVGEGAPDRGGIRRRSAETDEEFAARAAKRRNKLNRRETWRKRLYDAHVAEGGAERSRVYWGTWNSLLRSVDQARAKVLQTRKAGMPSDWRRPRWDADCTIAADPGGFRAAPKNHPWWHVEMRLASGWVTFRCKFGNWHTIPALAELKTCKLTRRKRGQGWEYSCSVVVAGMPDELTFATGAEPDRPGKRALLDGRGMVALDWGHREHDHPRESIGLRVFTWLGDDGGKGEVLLPAECRELLDSVDALKSRTDLAFDARKKTLGLPDRNRYGYRSRLLRAGPVTAEESLWLQWESRYERRMARARRRIQNLRRETYTTAIRMLRQRYGTFAIEDESIVKHRKHDIEEKTLHRKRQNRELSARYEFVQLCERLGATILPVPARNSTRECPRCGHLDENTTERLITCSVCGITEDKDERACVTIMKRAREALAKCAA